MADGETLAIAYEAYPTDRVMEGRLLWKTPTNDATVLQRLRDLPPNHRKPA